MPAVAQSLALPVGRTENQSALTARGRTGIGWAAAARVAGEGGTAVITRRIKNVLHTAAVELGPSASAIVLDLTIEADRQRLFEGGGSSVVPRAGSADVLRTAKAVGLMTALSVSLTPWRNPLARHDPGKPMLDLAVSLVICEDCLVDLAQLRGTGEVFGPVVSGPTVSWLVDSLATDTLAAIAAARATARARGWSLAAEPAPDHQASGASPLLNDGDATLVGGHSEKEQAVLTFKCGFGFPLWAFCDHGAESTGEPLAVVLRSGNAGSNTVTDCKTVLRAALAQLPFGHSGGKKVLVRINDASEAHEMLAWLSRRWLAYSVGFSLAGDLILIQVELATIPDEPWATVDDAGRQLGSGAGVVEGTSLFDPAVWPAGIRPIVCKQRPRPGAQLRISDIGGLRVIAYATNAHVGQLADLKLRYRRRARADHHNRAAEDTVKDDQGHARSRAIPDPAGL